MDYQEIITTVYNDIKAIPNHGELASYIPELEKTNPEKFGVFLSTVNGASYGIGDCYDRFSIQSISKVFSLSLAYHFLGGDIWERVGVEPSGTPFNSLLQLENDNGIPRNPFLNSGAMVVCDILVSQFEEPKKSLLDYIKKIAENEHIKYSKTIAESEKSIGYRNIALCNYIKSYDNIKNNPADVLDLYFNLCSIEMTCQELSKAFLYLANNGVTVNTKKQILTSSRSKRINAIMQTCGFYDESGEFTFKVGLPGKSGVGGGIIAIHPNQYAIAVWSPKLNEKGNSYRGMRFLEEFTTATASSIF